MIPKVIVANLELVAIDRHIGIRNKSDFRSARFIHLTVFEDFTHRLRISQISYIPCM